MKEEQSLPDLTYAQSDGSGTKFRTSVWQLLLPYWKSDEKWLAILVSVVIIGVGFVGVYIGVWRNEWTGEFYDAVGAGRFGKLVPLLILFAVIVISGTALTVGTYVANEYIELRWRKWLTDYLIEKWTRHKTYFRIERDMLMDNADQRIAEDVKMFCNSTLNLGFALIRVPVQAITFSVLIYNLTGNYKFHVGGVDVTIPAYMVIVGYLYTILTLVATHLAGRALIGLNVQQQKMEGDFRALLLQIREGSEQIAFYDGADTEASRLKRSFMAVRTNALNVIKVTGRVMFSTQVPGQVSSILPALLVLPQLSSGAMTIGGLMRVSQAFNSLEATLGFFPQAYQSFATWRAVVRRLLALLDAVEEQQPEFAIALVEQKDGRLEVGPLSLMNRGGAVLAHIPAFQIKPGARCMVRGRSGAGKSTLLRAIAGIWPYGQGTISVPKNASMMFVPQKSYVPVGTLKQALAYPSQEKDVLDADAEVALQACGLGKYTHCLSEVDRWGARLSGGEQQRLAFARILLKKPTHLFLDEATSALDDESEQRLYSLLVSELAESTIVSVAHRKEVAAFHHQFIDLTPHSVTTPAAAATEASVEKVIHPDSSLGPFRLNGATI
ncbi:ABC transporter ATP-binding protein/permease [Cupriavidus necator]